MTKILVVDDDAAIVTYLRLVLEGAGYGVVAATDGEAALRLFFEEKPDLLLLDVRMPKLDGNRTMARLRAVSPVPIIMLSGRGAEMDKVQSFDFGADDYVTKPVGSHELLARIQAVLRRFRAQAEPGIEETYEDGFLTVNFARHEASVGGQLVDLTPIEFRILVALLRHRGRTVSREDLADQVWGQRDESSDTVKWHVSRLRRKLGDDPNSPTIVLTVRGVGYRFDGAERPAQADEVRR